MSIREFLKLAVQSNWLVNLEPSLPSLTQKRVIFASRSLYDELVRELGDPSTAVRTAELMATFDTFLNGDLITVGGRRSKHAYMKQLEPFEAEVWEIRSVDPKPSIRVFGRFLTTDVFIATNKGRRSELGEFNSKNFRLAISYCGIEWRRCLPQALPHKGDSINDYISEHVFDLRDQ